MRWQRTVGAAAVLAARSGRRRPRRRRRATAAGGCPRRRCRRPATCRRSGSRCSRAATRWRCASTPACAAGAPATTSSAARAARSTGARSAPRPRAADADRGRADRLRLDARRRGRRHDRVRHAADRRRAHRRRPERPRCNRKPTRRFAARIAAPAPAGAPRPPAGAAFGGLSTIQSPTACARPVILKATSSGRRIAARWTALAALRPRPARGARELHALDADRRRAAASAAPSASPSATPTRSCATACASRAASPARARAGTLRMRARDLQPLRQPAADPLRLAHARLDRRAAAHDRARARTAPRRRRARRRPDPDARAGRTDPRRVVAEHDQRQRRLHRPGGTWSHGPPDDSRGASRQPAADHLHHDTDAEFQGGWWDTDFAAPPGQDLTAGTTYHGTSGKGRGCNTLTATFTVRELAFDANGRCGASAPTSSSTARAATPALRRHLGLPRRLTPLSTIKWSEIPRRARDRRPGRLRQRAARSRAQLPQRGSGSRG